MLSKLTSGPKIGQDLNKVGSGVSRGPAKKKLIQNTPWADSAWPSPGATLDLDFSNDRGYARGVGQGRSMDPVTFIRASNATYFDENGLLKYSIFNAIPYSSQVGITPSWGGPGGGSTGLTTTLNAEVAPDGTMTATRIADTTGTTYHGLAMINTSPGMYAMNWSVMNTFSIFVKDETARYVFLCVVNGYSAVFDLTTATITQTTTNTTAFGTYAKISPVGNGWYRISITGIFGNGNMAFAVGTAGSATPTLGTGISYFGIPTYIAQNKSLLLWGAQLERNAEVSEYQSNPGLAIHRPRFDWSNLTPPVTTTRNLRTHSNSIDTTTWTKNGVTVTDENIIPPPSISKSWLLTQTTNNSLHALYATTIDVTSNVIFTQSVFVKKATADVITFRCLYTDVDNNLLYIAPGLVFSFTTGTFIKSIQWQAVTFPTFLSYSAVDVGNGWYRLSFTCNSGSDSNAGKMRIGIQPHDSTLSTTNNQFSKSAIPTDRIGITGENYSSINQGVTFVGDGTSSVYVAGFQTERDTLTDYVEVGAARHQTGIVGANSSKTCNGLYIEEGRINRALWCRDATQGPSRNLLKYSQTFQNSVWETARGLVGSQNVAYGIGFNPMGAVFSTDGKFAYDATISNGALNIFSRNTTTGLLTLIGTTALSNSYGCVISPDNNQLYAIAGNLVYIYNRNITTGALTANGTIATGTGAQALCISPDGTNLYVVANGGSLVNIYSRDTSTGALTANGTIATSGGPNAIAISPDGKNVYVVCVNAPSSVNIFDRNTTTGALTANGTIATSTTPNYITVSPEGTNVYVTNSGANSISMYSRNTTSGALTSLGTVPAVTTNASSIIVSPDGIDVYITGFSSILGIFTRNPSTGLLTPNGTVPLVGTGRYLSISPDGNFLYLSGNGITTYVRVTGAITAADNTFTAPDSTSTAATLTATTANCAIRQRIAIAEGTYTFSVYLRAGTVTGNVSISFDGNIFTDVSLTSSWTRFSVSGSQLINPTLTVRIQNASDIVYIWGAQLDLASSASDYETTTNIGSIWSKQGITATKNQIGIDGNPNSATLLTSTTSGGEAIQAVTNLSYMTRISSIYLKRVSGSGLVQVTVDGKSWSTVELSSVEWKRISLQYYNNFICVGVKLFSSGDSIAIDYAQIEDSTFATTPILTTTTESSRHPDLASMIDNNFFGWFDYAKGTFLGEAIFPTVIQNMTLVGVTNPTPDFLGLYQTFVTPGGTFNSGYPWSVRSGLPQKIMFSYINGTNAIYASRGLLNSLIGGRGSVVLNIPNITIGNRGQNSQFLNGPIKRLIFWPKHILETQASAMTTD